MPAPFPKPAPDTQPLTDARQAEPLHRCKRCGKVASPEDQEPFFAPAELCFWCSYVDSQG